MSLFKNIDTIMNSMYETLRRKNADYVGGSVDEYKNFRLVEQLGICSLERGILVRMCDKMSRLSSILEEEAMVEDETIVDTLIDTANYAIILASYLQDKNEIKQ